MIPASKSRQIHGYPRSCRNFVRVIFESGESLVSHNVDTEFIEVLADGGIYRKFLKPGDAPETTFEIIAEKVEAREYCNLHGLWKA